MRVAFLWTCPHCQAEQWGSTDFESSEQQPFVILVCPRKNSYCPPTAARIDMHIKATLFTLQEVTTDFALAERGVSYNAPQEEQ